MKPRAVPVPVNHLASMAIAELTRLTRIEPRETTVYADGRTQIEVTGYIGTDLVTVRIEREPSTAKDSLAKGVLDVGYEQLQAEEGIQ